MNSDNSNIHYFYNFNIYTATTNSSGFYIWLNSCSNLYWDNEKQNWVMGYKEPQPILEPEEIKKTEAIGPVTCTVCNEVNEYAEPNQPDGTFICSRHKMEL